MNVIFVNHNGFSSNSAVHVTNLANAIAGMGHGVAVAVPEGDDTTPAGPVAFQPITYGAAFKMRFGNGQRADLLHAWTPRQHVARITRDLASAQSCRYAVHLEDNEYSLTATSLNITVEQLWARASRDPSFAVPLHMAQPHDMRAFLERAAGVTVLTERLMEHKPPQVPGIEIWPAAEDNLFYPRAADASLRLELGISENAKVIVYHGNVHHANTVEVRSLYLAVAALARAGMEIVLVRLGTDYLPVLPTELQDVGRLIIKVPFQPRERLPHYLALADLFVQPGRVDEFNAYRFPSKLPEFFAMGRPVILPATNIGLHVAAEQEAVLLHRGDAIEIAQAIKRVLSDQQLSDRLAAGARQFYERSLSWPVSAAKLARFYTRLDLKRR